VLSIPGAAGNMMSCGEDHAHTNTQTDKQTETLGGTVETVTHDSTQFIVLYFMFIIVYFMFIIHLHLHLGHLADAFIQSDLPRVIIVISCLL